MIGICQFCGERRPLVGAHITPRNYFQRVKGRAFYLEGVQLGPPGKAKRFQAGVKDKAILCSSCDNRFGVWDNYSYQVLDARKADAKFSRGKQAILLSEIPINFEKFSLFILSLLWRAAISNEPFYKRVEIGHHQSVIKDMLKNEFYDVAGFYSTVVSLLKPEKHETIMFTPYSVTLDGVAVVFFYMPPFKLMVKVDRRPFTR